MNYRLLIWDFDGTLVDSLEIALQVYHKLQPQYGLPPIEDPECVRDLSLPQFVRQFQFPVRRVPMLFKAFLSEFRSHQSDIRVHDGIPEVLQALRRHDVRNVVISSNSKANIHSFCESRDLSQYFDTIIGTSKIQGKRRSIAKALRGLNIDASQVLYVGDEVRDIEACHPNAVDVAAVEWGLNSRKALEAAGPAFLVHSPEQLLEIVDIPLPTSLAGANSEVQ